MVTKVPIARLKSTGASRLRVMLDRRAYPVSMASSVSVRATPQERNVILIPRASARTGHSSV